MPEIVFPGAPGSPQEGALVTEAERQKLADLPTDAQLTADLEDKADLSAGKVPVEQLPEVVRAGASGLMTGDQADDLENLKAAGLGTDLDYNASTGELSSSTGSGTQLPAAIPDSTSGLMTGDQAAKLGDIEANANNYQLPIASAGTIGGIRPGAGLVLDPATGVVSAEPVPGTGTDLSFNEGTGELVSSSGSNATIPAAGGANDFGLMTGARADKLDALRTEAQLTATLADKADVASTVNISGGAIVGYVESSDASVALPTIGGSPAPIVIFRNPLGPVLEYTNARPWDIQIDLSSTALRLAFPEDVTAYLTAVENADIASGLTGAMDYRIWNQKGSLMLFAKEYMPGPDVTLVHGTGARSIAGSLIPMFGQAPVFQNLQAGNFFDGDWRGDPAPAVRRYINSGVVESSFPTDDFFMGCFRSTVSTNVPTTSIEAWMGAVNSNGSGSNFIQPSASTIGTFYRNRQETAGTAIPSGGLTGLHATFRDSADGFTAINSLGSEFVTAAASADPVNRYIAVLARFGGAIGETEVSSSPADFVTGFASDPCLCRLSSYFMGPASSTSAAGLQSLNGAISSANTAIIEAISNPL